jgi:hypothetical protein
MKRRLCDARAGWWVSFGIADPDAECAISKKVENHAAAVALYFMYYNFGRVHQTLRVTPAMEAAVANV